MIMCYIHGGLERRLGKRSEDGKRTGSHTDALGHAIHINYDEAPQQGEPEYKP
jgi:hypothetical protein